MQLIQEYPRVHVHACPGALQIIWHMCSILTCEKGKS